MRPTPVTQDDRFRLGLFMGIVIVGGVIAASIAGVSSLRGRIPPPAAAVEFVERESDAADLLWPPTLGGLVPAVPLELPGEVNPAITRAAAKQGNTRTTRISSETVTYKGETFRYVKTLRLRVTAYAPDPRCTWPYDGKTTASGLPSTTNGGRLVAADTRLIPMYSMVRVPGYAGGAAVPVLDRGGAIKGHRLDVMLPTYEKAKAWGSRLIDVKVYRPVE